MKMNQNLFLYREEAKAEWCSLSKNKIAFCEQGSQTHLVQQPMISD